MGRRAKGIVTGLIAIGSSAIGYSKELTGWIGSLSVADDARTYLGPLWAKTAPMVDLQDAGWTVCGLSFLTLGWITFGDRLKASVVHPNPLTLSFVGGDRKGSAARLHNRTVGIIGRDVQDNAGSIIYRGVSFVVENHGRETVRDVSAAVGVIQGYPTKNSPPARRTWPLAEAESGLAAVDIRPGEAKHFVLMELAEAACGPGSAHRLDPNTERYQELLPYVGQGAFVGGFASGQRLWATDGIRLGVSVHGHDVPATHGWFAADLRSAFRVRFRKASSLG